MKQHKQGINIFHFKMDLEMKNRLKDLDLFKQVGNLSGLIVQILTIIAPYLEKEHFSMKQMESKYKLIHDDQEIERESIHVYMPVYLYKQLKMMHQDLNVYSIAQLLRGFLLFFLDLIDKFGDNYLRELENLMGCINANNEKLRFSQEIIIQLLQFIHQRTRRIRLFTVYNDIFCPIKILWF